MHSCAAEIEAIKAAYLYVVNIYRKEADMPDKTEEFPARESRPRSQFPQTSIDPNESDIPSNSGLHSSGRRSSQRKNILPPINIGTAERVASFAGGGLLVLYGLARRSWPGIFLAGAGVLLAHRGMSGRSYLYERLGVDKPGAPLEVNQVVTINRDIGEVYAFWRKLENLPVFMKHLRSVQQITNTRSRWVAQVSGKGPAQEWESEILEDKPNELIRWRGLPNGGIQHSGVVRFRRAPGNRGTEVQVQMEYRPPVGMTVAALMYPVTKQMLREEIRRFKWVMEAGEIPTTEGQPSGRMRGQPFNEVPAEQKTQGASEANFPLPGR